MADLEEDTGKPRQVIFYKAGMKDDVYAILKSVAIHEDLTYVIHANGRLLRSWDAEINIFSAQDVEAIVQIVHAKQFCRGCPLIDVTNSSRVTKKVGVKRGTNIVGCSEHANQLTAQTIHFYLTTRMHFFARAKCLENSSAVRAQRERKKAKLV
ncbi:hypothetical protein MRX96_031051 [Rhipicephalus microplus]